MRFSARGNVLSLSFLCSFSENQSVPPALPQTRCCIVGGGPAGMMLGFLLARAGVEALVLEKHADFLRDFRGDTIHPSTLELMYELGLLEEFLKRPHQEILLPWLTSPISQLTVNSSPSCPNGSS